MNRHLLALELRNANVEAHAESYNHTTRSSWKIVPDGSVSWGEIVSPILTGESGYEAIRNVCRIANANGASVNQTCGLHVHIGVRHLRFEQLRSICSNWYKAQNVIDMLIASSRRGNPYYAHRNTNANYHSAVTIDTTTTATELQRAFCNTRYSKLNVECYTRQGTFEWRGHQGTTDARKINTWVTFLQRFVTASADGVILDDFTNSPLTEATLTTLLAQLGCTDELTTALLATARRVRSI
jgi:hypothetical protein